MRFRFGGTEVRITVWALLFAVFCIVIGEGRTLLFAVLSLALHETAHALAAHNVGCPVASVAVWPFGAVMRLDRFFLQENAEWIVASAGPLSSLFAAGVLALFKTQIGGEGTEALYRTNLAIGLINLLPAYPLDGGRVFRSLLTRVASERAVKRVLLVFTAVIALGCIGAAAYLFASGVHVLALWILPPFLMGSAFSELRRTETGLVSRVMERRKLLRSGSAQTARIVVLSENATVADALFALSARRFTIVRVLCGGSVSELDESAVLSAAAKFGTDLPLKSLISRLTAGK